MNILVTGGAGYLGSELVPRLLNLGHKVTVMDSFRHGVPSLAHIGGHNALHVINGDVVREPGLFHSLVQESEAIIQLAAIVGGPACDFSPAEAAYVNQRAAEELASMKRPDQMVIFPCTNSGYGKGGEEAVSEHNPMTPLSHYGRTKVAAESAILEAGGVSLRLATLYGSSARMRLDLLVNEFVRKAVLVGHINLYEPHYRRCVLNVFDAATAIVYALTPHHYKNLAGRPWNVGAENVTKLQLCVAIQQQHSSLSWNIEEGSDPDQRDYAVSWQAFHTVTGWAPTIKLDDGIAQLVRLYKQPFDGPQWRNA